MISIILLYNTTHNICHETLGIRSSSFISTITCDIARSRGVTKSYLLLIKQREWKCEIF